MAASKFFFMLTGFHIFYIVQIERRLHTLLMSWNVTCGVTREEAYWRTFIVFYKGFLANEPFFLY